MKNLREEEAYENRTGKEGRTLSDLGDGEAGGRGKPCPALLGGGTEAADPPQ